MAQFTTFFTVYRQLCVFEAVGSPPAVSTMDSNICCPHPTDFFDVTRHHCFMLIYFELHYTCAVKYQWGKYSMQPDINWVTRHTERAGKTWNVHKLKFLWIMNTWTRQPVKMFTGGIDNLSNINNAQVMGSGAINCDSNSNQWISQTKWAFVSDVTKNWGHPLCLTPEFRSLLSGPYRSRISSCALFPWLTPRLQLQVNYLAAFSIEKNCLNANSVFGVTCRLGIKKKSQFYCHDGSKFW